MGPGVRTAATGGGGGGGGVLNKEASRPLVLPLIEELSPSLSEIEPGREMVVSAVDVRRIILPMRADHRGLELGLGLAIGRLETFSDGM